MILEHIARETGVDAASIEATINSADRLYKTYNIKKRTQGFRVISQPTPALKFLQRWVVRNFIIHLPVHANVTSYRKGIGVYKNASMHAAHNYLMKMDFENFFPSITKIDVRKLMMDNSKISPISELDDKDIDLIARIVCKADRLTIGAPSSPSISNAILYRFDDFISKESANRRIQYSRYADDISFSTNTPHVLDEMHGVVANALLNQFSPRLTINEKKTAFTSKKRRRLVTGLVLTSDNRVSIGRSKKREVKTLFYHFSAGKLSPDKISYLSGYISYVRSVEPSFIQSLQKKYGEDAMQKLLGTSLIPRK